jgi:ABC-type arginine/histidine transport system permease subunit
MQDHNAAETPVTSDMSVHTEMSSTKKNAGASLTWRLTQIVLVLAAAYLYILFASVGGLLQRDRLMSNPHMTAMIQVALLGIGIGLCIGFALKTFGSGQFAIVVDWPTLVINLLAAGIFAVIAFSFAVAAARNTDVLRGAYRDATWLSPLLPFVWIGLTLSTIVKAKE